MLQCRPVTGLYDKSGKNWKISAAKCKQIPKEIKHKVKRKVRFAIGNRARLIAVEVLSAQMYQRSRQAPEAQGSVARPVTKQASSLHKWHCERWQAGECAMCSEPGQPGRPLPRPYTLLGPNEQGKRENRGRGNPGAQNETKPRPKQGPHRYFSLEPRRLFDTTREKVNVDHCPIRVIWVKCEMNGPRQCTMEKEDPNVQFGRW